MPANRRAPRRNPKVKARSSAPPLGEFVRERLARRTKSLRKAVERVHACQAAEPESIHALRVACRRLEATLAYAGPLLRHTGWWSRTLRRLRKLAGPVRDCDIIAHTLAAAPAAAAIAEPLLARSRKKRAAKLGAEIKALRRKQALASRSKRLCAAPQIPRQRATDAGAWFTQALRESARAALPQLAAAPAAWPIAHALRLTLKRLRYGLELALAAQASRPQQQLLAQLRQWQDRLGAVCDAESSQALFAALCEKLARKNQPAGKRTSAKQPRREKPRESNPQAELEPLRDVLRRRVAAEWKRLRRWLTPERRRRLRAALTGE